MPATAPEPQIAGSSPLDLALSYTARGWPVFPCRAADEFTDDFDRETGERIILKAKSPLTPNGLKGATTNERIVREWWRRYPDAMVGVPTGERIGFWVLDVDVHPDDLGEVENGYETLAALEAEHGLLPQTATVRTAGGGEHRYFKFVSGVRNRGRLGAGLDVRGAGGYVIAPGNQTVDGREYVWVEHSGTGVPDIAEAPEWLLALVLPQPQPEPEPEPDTRPLTSFRYEVGGHEAYVERAVEDELRILATTRTKRGLQVVTSAFKLGTFVGAELLARSEAEAGLYEAARANGVLAKDGDKEIRAKIKRGLDAGRLEPRSVPERTDNTPLVDTTAMVRSALAGQADTFAGSPEPETPPAANDNRELVAVPPMHADPFSPEAAGGLLADIARWITANAIIPVPELSLAASLALLGGIFGKHALTPTRAGVNLYLTTLLGTAGGKGHPPKAIRLLSERAGMMGAVSNGDPTSYSAMERILRKNSSTVVVMDEFGLTLQDVNAKHRNAVAAGIRKFLLAVYDQSNGVFDGRVYASAETKKDEAPIRGPALTVLGMTTVDTLYAGLSEASVSDGFLNRFLFITAKPPAGIIRPPRLDGDSSPPPDLVDSIQSALATFPKQSILPGSPKTVIRFQGGEDGAAYQRWGEVFIWQQTAGMDITGRAAENTIRLATIRAISRKPSEPEVSLEDVEWAWAIVYSSTTLIAEGIRLHMSSSPAEALRKSIISALHEAKDNTLPYSHLMKRKGVSGADIREFAGAVRWLIDAGEIVDVASRPAPGRGSKFRLNAVAT